MRIGLFEGPGAGRGIRPGVVTGNGIVDVSSAMTGLVAHSPQQLMTQLIDNFDDLRPAFERLSSNSVPLPLDIVRIRPPLPRPGKFINCIVNYWEHRQSHHPLVRPWA